MQQHPQIIGVDVAGDELVMAVHGQGSAVQRVANQGCAIRAWLATVAAGSTVAMEATGSHHRLLAQLAHEHGLRVFVLNAADVYFYARAVSARGKTDRLDAVVIARYAGEHQDKLRAWVPPSQAQQLVQDLLRRRARATRLMVSLRQSLTQMPTLREAAEAVDRGFEQLFEQIDGQLRQLVQRDAQLQRGVALLSTINGVGPQGAVMLASLFNRIGFANADAVVAYSGLDPRPCDSGTKRGKRRLSKRGPALLRRQLYLAAFGASHSKALKPLYEAIKARGFAPTQALNILARKLLRVAWAVWRSGQPFEAQRLMRED